MKYLFSIASSLLFLLSSTADAADCSVGSIVTLVSTKWCYDYNKGASVDCATAMPQFNPANFSVDYEIYFYGKNGKVIVTKDFNVAKNQNQVVCLEQWKPGAKPYAIINSQYQGGYPYTSISSVPMNTTGMVRYLVIEPVVGSHLGDSVTFCKSNLGPGKQSEICPLGN